ncbi:uncharacterized protein jcada [Leuresthes tenuis]|uniref:uncharacterized protein jcada n=1 Tax=Leuresthes tenuis TaxID=355514 RepID=UPI003B507DD5
MYSVEDLLISHGYKLPRHNISSTPTPTPERPSSSLQPPLSLPPSYSEHHEILENRPRPRTVNGYERSLLVPFGNSGMREPQVYSCPNNNQPQNRSQLKQESENQGHTDNHSLGESLTSDSGFCDSAKGPQLQSKDVSYWRRRGQDFTVLLDYADFKGLQKARGQELPPEDCGSAAQERQCWAAQIEAQGKAQAQALCRDREAALHQWRMVTDRKCQSLETDEWHSAIGFGHQLSKGNGERLAQEQQRLYARTPEGMVIHPRTKDKSQSLPRMLRPDNLHYVDIALSGQELYRRINGHPLSHHHLYRAPRWPENGRPASANQLSMTPKPRFTRPPRPPSYEMHQQIRGSCEVLSGREFPTPQSRDRTPLPISRTTDPQLDYFAQDSGPPVYIPPPSYKRAPIMGGGLQGYGQIAIDYRCRDDMYQQMQVAPDESHWFIRYPTGSWPDPHTERRVSNQKQCYPVYSSKEHPGGGVQCIPFDDPHIHRISSALGGNSLTDADKIRHIRNELPSVTVSELSRDNSAFLAPQLGPFIAANLADEANLTSSSCDNKRWQSNLHKETVDNLPATDQNCNNRHLKIHHTPPSPYSAFQAPVSRASSQQGSSSDQVFAETITQVKKIVPDSRTKTNRNAKRRVSETIFCLVSVPVHMPTNFSNDLSANQNNEAVANLTIANTGTFAVGLKESANIRSQSVNEMPIKSHKSHFHTSNTSLMSKYKRAPLRKEIIDAWAHQANEDKELGYTGSWPGNQYRNQETQTCSLLTVVNSPEPQSLTAMQEPVQSASNTNTDRSVAVDSSSSYGYPMAGQKNLHPSRNSAFSRLSLSPTQTPPLQDSQQDPSSHPKARNQGDQQLSSPRKRISQESPEQVVFGQFLLKPVNRRPCDAIGELETINKGMEDTIRKRPNAGQFRDDLDGVKKRQAWFKSRAHFVVGPQPGREAISLPPLHMGMANNIKKRSKSFASTVNIESMDMKGGFPRPHADNTPPKNELSILSNPRPSCLFSSVLPHSELNRLYRQDIPVPQESLLRDVGLTVYTETPGGPGEPVQRSLLVPSPLDHKDLSHSVQLSWKTRRVLVENGGSSEHNSNEELECKVNSERKAKSDNVPPFRGEVIVSICKTRNEGCSPPQKESLRHFTRKTREVSFVIEDDKRYTLSEPMTCKNDSTVADKHLESFLLQEKASTSPAEGLSNLYEVRYGKGISKNESIEERAARILGIAVPVEALAVADKPSGDNQGDVGIISAVKPLSLNAETEQVIVACEQVMEETVTVQGADTEGFRETGSVTNQEELKDNSDSGNNQDTETQSVQELPEFPPSKCLLSLPVIPDEKLALSMCSEVEKGKAGDSKLTESLQDKLNGSTTLSTTSLARSSTDRMASLKEVDSVSQIRLIDLKSPERPEEAVSKERDDATKKCEVQEESKEKDVLQDPQKEKEKKKVDEKGKGQEHENEQIKMGHLDQPKEDSDRLCKEDQRHENDIEEMTVEIELKTDIERSKELHVELKMEEGKMEFKIVEEAKEHPLEMVKDEHNTAVVNRAEFTLHAEGGKLPKPKQRTRLQRPPLLPKPCSVSRREIALPLSFSTGTCGSTSMEDEEMLSVSDSYDPSRVEKV